MYLRLLLISIIFYSCSAQRMIQTDLYFGQSTPGGGVVAEKEWDEFVEKHISRVYKEGSTITKVNGHWFDPEAKVLIQEPTYVVSYVHPRSAEISNQIDSLRYLYKTLHRQQSVLRVDRKVKASF